MDEASLMKAVKDISNMHQVGMRDLLRRCWDTLFLDSEGNIDPNKDLGSDELAELVNHFRLHGLAPMSEPMPETTGGSPSEEPPTMNAFALGRMVRT